MTDFAVCCWRLVQGLYASLGICKTPVDWRNMAILVGSITAILAVNFTMKGVSTARVTRKRNRALQALEKEQ